MGWHFWVFPLECPHDRFAGCFIREWSDVCSKKEISHLSSVGKETTVSSLVASEGEIRYIS